MSATKIGVSAPEIIPVLDVRGGRAVHARGGDRGRYSPVSSVLVSGSDPRALAGAYRERLRTARLYVADLDAIARSEDEAGSARNGGRLLAATRHLVRDLVEDGARLWIDAGARDESAISTLLELGAERVVIGLETLPDLDRLAGLVSLASPASLAFSLDIKDGRPLTRHAWDSAAIARTAIVAGFSCVIVLDLDRVGGDEPDLERLRAIRDGSALDSLPCGASGASGAEAAADRRWQPGNAGTVRWVAGGGIRTRRQLADVWHAGYDACLVGSALHDGRLLDGALDDDGGLLDGAAGA